MCTLPWQCLLFHCVYWILIDCCQDINILFVMMKNSLSHKSSASKALYKVAIKVSPLSLNICMRTDPFCFAVTWCPSATSMNLSVSYNDPGMKSVTSGVIWQVSPESKIQLVDCELSPSSLFLLTSSFDIRAIDAYTLRSSSSSLLSFALLPFYFELSTRLC